MFNVDAVKVGKSESEAPSIFNECQRSTLDLDVFLKL